MVLAEWLEDALERRDRRREVEAAWKEWRTRLEEARQQGRRFTEPPPGGPSAGSPTVSPGPTGSPIRVRYDRTTDALTIVLRDGPVEHSEEPTAGLILDFDDRGEVLAIELLDASRKTSPQISVQL